MDQKNQTVRILLAEDVPTDAELVKREIRKVLPESSYRIVETREDFTDALKIFAPDLIVSDYRMPTFDGMEALKIAIGNVPDTPVIIVTGSINEETAVNCLKAGAVDYVLKESLKRLGQAVLNALEQKEIKQKKREAEKSLRESEERFRRLAENAQDLIYRIELLPERKFSYVSPAALQITGFTPEEHYSDPDLGLKLVHPDDRHILEKMSNGEDEIRKHQIFRWIKKDRTLIWIEQRNIPIYNELGELVAIEGIARDITGYKEAMEALQESEKEYRRLINGMNETIWIVDLEGRVLDVNKAAVKTLGYSRPELKESGIGLVDKYLKAEEVMQLVGSMKEDKIQIFETEHTTKDGRVFPVEISSSLIKYRGENVILSVARDISDRRKIEDELKLVNRSVEQSPVSIVVTNSEGIIEYVNSAFSKVTGYLPEEIKGKTPRILKSGKQPEWVYKNLWDTILAGKEWIGELMNKKKNGELYWANVSISPVLNTKGEITHFVSAREDITEKKKMIEDLVTAKEKAEESDRLKSAFLANMSHEIRTPMNGILGFANLLKEPKLTVEEKENFVNIIESSGQRMLATINDLIDISKIESGMIEVEYSKVNIHEEMQLLFSFFEPEASKKGLKFFYRYESTHTDTVMVSDKLKLNAIMTNLIKNALKYTLDGSVEFGFRLENETVLFFIRDTGIGIDKNRQDAIFERFVQADNSISRGFEGSGLGLSISKAYVEMLKGRIWVESVKGKGSDFYFVLPRRVDGSGKLQDEMVSEKENKTDILNDLTILAAEDDEVGRLYLATIFEKKCKKIMFTSNGLEAVNTFRGNRDINLILMDIRMPLMDGYTATKKIREIDKNVVVVAQTAYAMAGDREKALAAGCHDYITKPLNRKKLLELIDKHFHK
jgi:PAS domain S-box-containing protein